MHNRKACLHGFAVETKKRPTLKFPSHQAAKRLLLEKEEQRHERTPTYKKSRSKRYKACSNVNYVKKDASVSKLTFSPNRSPAKRIRFGKEEQGSGRMTFFCKKNVGAKRTLLRRGAGGRTRTGTLSPAVDFESTTSTNSITPAWCLYSILYFSEKCKKKLFAGNRFCIFQGNPKTA